MTKVAVMRIRTGWLAPKLPRCIRHCEHPVLVRHRTRTLNPYRHREAAGRGDPLPLRPAFLAGWFSDVVDRPLRIQQGNALVEAAQLAF